MTFKIPAAPLSLAMTLLLAFTLGSCTIVRHGASGSVTTSANSGEFDSVGYVSSHWEAQVLPEFSQNAADLAVVLAALKADPDAARARYGRRQEETAPFSFIVKGTVKVKAVNLESAAATVELAVQAPTPEGVVLLQIGPVIKSSAVRDVLSFVHFGDFTNQVDFANVSRALNSRVKETVVNALDREHLAGKTLTFLGAFAEDAGGEVLITPIALEVQK